jgi:hypothetical protein
MPALARLCHARLHGTCIIITAPISRAVGTPDRRVGDPTDQLPQVRPVSWSTTFSNVTSRGARNVVRTFAGIRLAVGVAFAVAPHRLNGGSGGTSSDTLMTRSFAVREIALGVGGLIATTQPDASPSALRLWAGLGALTDGGDLAAALAEVRRREPAAVAALLAAAGLLTEGWALRALDRP